MEVWVVVPIHIAHSVIGTSNHPRFRSSYCLSCQLMDIVISQPEFPLGFAKTSSVHLPASIKVLGTVKSPLDNRPATWKARLIAIGNRVLRSIHCDNVKTINSRITILIEITTITSRSLGPTIAIIFVRYLDIVPAQTFPTPSASNIIAISGGERLLFFQFVKTV